MEGQTVSPNLSRARIKQLVGEAGGTVEINKIEEFAREEGLSFGPNSSVFKHLTSRFNIYRVDFDTREVSLIGNK